MSPLHQKKGVALAGPVVLGVSTTTEKFKKDSSSRYRFVDISLVQNPVSGLVQRAGEKRVLGISVPHPTDKLPNW